MISVIFPIYNERESITPFFDALTAVLDGSAEEFEVIAVDDGSFDGGFEILRGVAGQNKKIKLIRFARNFGQTAALSAGIQASRGDVLVTIDGDLENDPKDIPKLIAKLKSEKLDVVSGWRVNRWQGSFFTRKFPSMIANALISSVSGVKLHDYGCTLKAYRREVIAGIPLYGEMHRFIPAYAYLRGAKIGECAVSYTPRRFGKSKYGFSRTFRVILDLLFMKFLVKYMTRPIHFFGGLGLGTFFLGLLAGGGALVLKFMGTSFVRTPLPILSIFLILVGTQFIVTGIIAEILMRIYYESQGKQPYQIKETVNLEE
ncbi:MAG: glycosyltransferase family 2 protein [Patescibacteria group bacterium]